MAHWTFPATTRPAADLPPRISRGFPQPGDAPTRSRRLYCHVRFCDTMADFVPIPGDQKTASPPHFHPFDPDPRNPSQAHPNPSRTHPNLCRISPNLSPIFPNLRRTLPNLSRTLPNLRRTSPNLRQTLPNLRRTLPNLRRTSPNLRRTSPNLRRTSPNLDRIQSSEFKIQNFGLRSPPLRERFRSSPSWERPRSSRRHPPLARQPG